MPNKKISLAALLDRAPRDVSIIAHNEWYRLSKEAKALFDNVIP